MIIFCVVGKKVRINLVLLLGFGSLRSHSTEHNVLTDSRWKLTQSPSEALAQFQRG